MRDRTYFVTDIETNGPYPGVHSMLGFACVACRVDEGIISNFEINIEPLPEMTEHLDVMSWWETQPDAFEYICKNRIQASKAMHLWAKWVESFEGIRIFVAHPMIFDGLWMDWYAREFLDTPLRRGPLKGYELFMGCGLDLASFASGLLKTAPGNANFSDYPKELLGDIPHSHRAIDDARGYAHLLLNLLEMRGDDPLKAG